MSDLRRKVHGTWRSVPVDPPESERRSELSVASRPAFFTNSPASHATYQIDGVRKGLAGDAGSKMEQDFGAPSLFTQHGPMVEVKRHEASAFAHMASGVAHSMTYNLITQNCYTPIAVALSDLRARHTIPAAVGFGPPNLDNVGRAAHSMLSTMGEQNFGAGQLQGTIDHFVKKTQ